MNEPRKITQRYQFVGFEDSASSHTLNYDDHISKSSKQLPVLHEYFGNSLITGRLICRIETLSPTLVSNSQNENETHPQSYLNAVGQQSISGSTLRGRISAICELLSNSALRVADNRRVVVRRAYNPDDKIYIGWLQRGADKWQLKAAGVSHWPKEANDRPQFGQGDTHSAISHIALPGAKPVSGVNLPEEKNLINSVKTHLCEQKSQPIDAPWVNEQADIFIEALIQRFVDQRIAERKAWPRSQPYFRFTCKESPSFPLVLDDTKKIQLQNLRGIVCAEKRPKNFRDQLRSALHEYFSIASPVVYRAPDSSNNFSGDISFANWTQTTYNPEKPRVFDFLTPNHRPWSTESGRTELTPAEVLFGVIQDCKADQEAETHRHLKGRLSFSDVYFANTPKTEQLALRHLDAPKPNSLAMYFGDQRQDGFYPTGRKFYVPRKQTDYNPLPSANSSEKRTPKQATAISSSQAGYFWIDLLNLRPVELELLLTALCPDTQFEHTVGYGKPIGMGRVRLHPIELWHCNHEARYQGGLGAASKYESKQALSADQSLAEDELPAQLRAERDAIPNSDRAPLDISNLMKNQPSLVSHSALSALKTISNSTDLTSYPLIKGQKHDQTDGFKWFAANRTTVSNDSEASLKKSIDQAIKERLKPVSDSVSTLPKL